MKKYRIETNARMVFIEYSGVVVHTDLLVGVEEYGRLGPTYSILIDLTGVTNFKIDSDHLRRVARLTSGAAARQRCAVIAPTPTAYGLARMYEVFCSSETGDTGVGVFRDAESARRWVGLSE
jgi:hypothetical protein